jgi:hypothetical protein
MGDNDIGYSHRHAVNLPTPATADRPMPMVGGNIGCEPPPGILGALMSERPHDAGPRDVVHVPLDSRPPRNDMPPGLLRANGVLNPTPHVYGGDPKEPNTYGLSRLRR